MKNARRGLAWLLTLLMLVTALPTTALAAEGAAGEAVQAEDAVVPAEEAPAPAEEIIYFSDAAAVTVTTDAAKAGTVDAEGNPYAVFDADGSYTIPLPAWTEFPTAVDFRVGEQNFRVVYGNETETNDVGGHIFRVRLEEPAAAEEPDAPVEPELPQDLFVVIDGQQVPVLPEEVAPLSMLPLEEKHLNLDLREYFPSELESVDISDLLQKLADADRYQDITQNPDDVAAWYKYSYYDKDGNVVRANDDYVIVGADKTLDLSNYYRYGSDNFTLELIIGTADPLNPDNIRYHIDVYTRGIAGDELLSAEAYSTADPRAKIEIYDTYFNSFDRDGKRYNMLYMTANPKDWQNDQEAYVGLSLDPELQGVSAKVYEGRYETEEDLKSARDITDQILNQSNLAGTGGYRSDFTWKNDYDEMPVVTLALTRESSGEVVLVLPVILYMYEGYMSLSSSSLYAERENGGRDSASNSHSYDRNSEYTAYIYELRAGYKTSDEYYYNLRLYNPADPDNDSDNGLKYVKKAVVGYYKTESEIPASAVDIKDQLFTDAYRDGGYKANYSNTVVFTVVDTEGGIHWQGIQVVEAESELPNAPKPLSADTYFRMQGATGLRAYTMPYDSDSYYFNGFQTVLLLDQEGPVSEGSTITPRFYTGDKVDIRLGHNDENGLLSSGEKQISGESQITFNNGQAKLYSAAAENGKALKNYWVTFLTQQKGAKLFVNGVNDDSRQDEETGNPVREVFLTEDYNYHHDIFFANIGDEELTGLKVTLTDAQNIQLDDYWTIHADGTTTLAPFTTTYGGTSYGELANVSKIRLKPVMVNGEIQSGAVSGTLTISSDNGGEVKIKLKGTAGTPKIVTDTLVQGVKYVHYSTLIQTNSMYGTNSVTFTATGLPSGLNIKPNGEIYGVPLTYGNYQVTVTAEFTGEVAATDTRTYTLVILDNTDGNVAWATQPGNQGYPFEEYEGGNGMIPDQTITVTDQIFHSSGDFGEFMNVFLDGRELTKGTDYVAEDGSTKITVRSQTFRNAGNGSHTISAEFRTGGDKDGIMHRTAQNFKISGLNGGGSSGGNSGGGNSGGGNSSSSKPSSKPSSSKPSNNNPSGNTPGTTTPATPPATPTVADIMQDIRPDQWFFKDVDWAYQKGLMVGVTSNTYLPDDPISFAMAAVVLSRLYGADLTPWTSKTAEGVVAGQWYSAAASWAKECAILPAGQFQADVPVRRGEMAIILVNYLKYLGKDCTLPAQQVAFTDAAQMTAEENTSFQVLYQFGIFKGVGNNTMDVAGSATRAQFAALTHRLSVFVGA